MYMTLFPKRDPTDEQRSLTAYPTMDSKEPGEKGRLGKLATLRWPLLVWAIFGTALTLSDGILTWVRPVSQTRFAQELARASLMPPASPAVSVISAVEGIAVAQPSVTNAIVGVSIAFLVFLFALQPLGTQKISFFFAPG
jgi:KUP system potassium uptake protein